MVAMLNLKYMGSHLKVILILKKIERKLIEEGSNPIGPGFLAKKPYTKELFENYEFFSK